MKIELRNDIPIDLIHISTVHEVPYHFEKHADYFIKELN